MFSIFDLFKPKIRPEVTQLVNSILNDDGWVQKTEYTFGNHNTTIWTSSGVSEIDFYPNTKAFTNNEKAYIHEAIVKRKISDAIGG